MFIMDMFKSFSSMPEKILSKIYFSVNNNKKFWLIEIWLFFV